MKMEAFINNASIVKFYAPVGTCQHEIFEFVRQVGGATIYRARGVWESNQGEIFDEECDVVEVVHPCSKAELLVPSVQRVLEKFLDDNPKELAALAVLQGADGVKSVYLTRK
jgi:hypothetical protein